MPSSLSDAFSSIAVRVPWERFLGERLGDALVGHARDDADVAHSQASLLRVCSRDPLRQGRDVRW